MGERRDYIEEVLEKGIDLKNRRVYFGHPLDTENESGIDGSDFMWTSVERVVRAIHLMESKSKNLPIELHMDSGGGSPFAMLRLIDTILASPCQFKFIGGGLIASAATWVMVVCDERYLHANTYVIIHDSAAGTAEEVPSKLSDMYIAVDHEKELQTRLNKMFAANSRMPESFWADIIKRDVYLTADEAITLGIADKIIDHKKRGNLRRVRIAALGQPVNKKSLQRLVKDICKRTYKTTLDEIKIITPEEQFDPTVVIGDPAVENALPLPTDIAT